MMQTRIRSLVILSRRIVAIQFMRMELSSFDVASLFCLIIVTQNM